MIYRKLEEKEINRELFQSFIRKQIVHECKRKINGEWKIILDPFIDDWNEGNYYVLIQCLRNTVATNGVVYGAFCDGKLKGFVSVESEFIGSRHQYADLTSIHVSMDVRGKGIGRTLFEKAASWAREHGAKKLYISAHSAIETQRFYEAMGCVEAEEYSKMHVDMEPCDCQMEYVL